MMQCEQGCRQVQELAALNVLILIFSSKNNPMLFMQSNVDQFVSRYCKTCSRQLLMTIELSKMFKLCDQSMSKYLYNQKEESSYHCVILGSKIRKKSFFLSLKHFLERIYAHTSPPIPLLLLMEMVLRNTEMYQHQEFKIYSMYRQVVMSSVIQAKLLLQTKKIEEADRIACEWQAVLEGKKTSYGYLLSQIYYLKACICQRKGYSPVQQLRKSIKDNNKNKAAYMKLFEYLLYPSESHLIKKYLEKYSECIGNDASLDAIRVYLAYNTCRINATLFDFDKLYLNIRKDPQLQYTYAYFNYCLGLINMEKNKAAIGKTLEKPVRRGTESVDSSWFSYFALQRTLGSGGHITEMPCRAQSDHQRIHRPHSSKMPFRSQKSGTLDPLEFSALAFAVYDHALSLQQQAYYLLIRPLVGSSPTIFAQNLGASSIPRHFLLDDCSWFANFSAGDSIWCSFGSQSELSSLKVPLLGSQGSLIASFISSCGLIFKII